MPKFSIGIFILFIINIYHCPGIQILVDVGIHFTGSTELYLEIFDVSLLAIAPVESETKKTNVNKIFFIIYLTI